eukprot:7800008-Pyramimonas_sp.AAC.1
MHYATHVAGHDVGVLPKQLRQTGVRHPVRILDQVAPHAGIDATSDVPEYAVRVVRKRQEFAL